MSTLFLLLLAGGLVLILIVIGVVISLKSGQSITEERLGRYLDEEDKTDSANSRLAGDSTLDAPLPDVKKKKGKGK